MKFSQWLENQYLEWQRNQGGRKTVMEFAEYLGVSQQTLSSWMNETRTPQGDNIRKLADKLGLEVYDVLGLERPDPVLYYINKHWEDLPQDVQHTIFEEAEGYIDNNEKKKHAPTPSRRTKRANT